MEACWEPSAEYTVGALVDGSLSGGSGLVGRHLDSQRFFDVGPLGKLCAMVQCEGFEHGCELAAQSGGDDSGGASCIVAAGQIHQQGTTAGALNQGGRLRAKGH